MKKIFSFLKRNTLVIAISFSLGGFAGYKVLESLGIAFLLSSIPIPEGSIADKDAFIEFAKDFNTEKSLVKMVGKRRNLLEYLKKTDIERYRDIIKKLGIRK